MSQIMKLAKLKCLNAKEVERNKKQEINPILCFQIWEDLESKQTEVVGKNINTKCNQYGLNNIPHILQKLENWKTEQI